MQSQCSYAFSVRVYAFNFRQFVHSLIHVYKISKARSSTLIESSAHYYGLAVIAVASPYYGLAVA